MNKPSYHAQHIDAITKELAAGIKSTCGPLGIELEHIIVKTSDISAVPYEKKDTNSSEVTVSAILEQLKSDYTHETRDDDNHLLALARNGETVTLEPAAQVEFSGGPFATLALAEQALNSFETRLHNVLDPLGTRALLAGYHPSVSAENLTLIPKARYEYMNTYFGKIGPYGQCMMRGSASTQVSIDFTSEADCMRKYRLACRLAPLFALISDNAATFNEQPQPCTSVRTLIWKHTDPARCGIIKGSLADTFGFENYAEYILALPAIVAPNEDNPKAWHYDTRSFEEIYENRPMTSLDVQHAISMAFNDVRIKQFIEIRPADALPVPFALSYAALIKGLFTTEYGLQNAEALVGELTENDIALSKEAIMEKGYKAHIGTNPAQSLAQQLFAVAASALDPEDKPYLQPLENLAAQGKTLAENAELR